MAGMARLVKAFQCRAEHCGTEVNLYLRAKIGFCNCVSAIDDEEVDRVGDVRAELGSGRPIDVRWMKGRTSSTAIWSCTGRKRRSDFRIPRPTCFLLSWTGPARSDRSQSGLGWCAGGGG